MVSQLSLFSCRGHHTRYMEEVGTKNICNGKLLADIIRRYITFSHCCGQTSDKKRCKWGFALAHGLRRHSRDAGIMEAEGACGCGGGRLLTSEWIRTQSERID